MTELSYTAWDDNRYQWPPPEGWYQASDGKWWPEGYGPVANQATTGASAETTDAVDEAETAPTLEEVHDESHDDGSFDDEPGADDGDDATVDEFEAPDESASYVAANGTSEGSPVAQPEQEADLDSVGSGFAGSAETAHPAESRYESESRYDSDSRLSTSSAGMAASGFASRAEGGSSSLGLAGWAQTGSSDIGNRVDISHEYDYSRPDGESDDLLESTEVADDDHDLDASTLDTSDADALAPFDPRTDDAAFDSSTAETPTADAPTIDAPMIDTPAEPVDSTLSRLDDLKRQVEQQSFPTSVAGAGATATSDLDAAGFDPTETLDIDPDDLKLESNPHYGGTEETGYGAGLGIDKSDAEAHEGDHVGADAGVVHGYDDRIETDSESYSFTSVEDGPTEATAGAETRQYGYEGDVSPPVGDQPVPDGAEYGGPQADYSGTPTLSPISSPTPKPGPGRMVLYAVIGLLALAVAGVAGYLLFQLQGDDGEVSDGDGGATAAVDGSDAGPSDLSGQGPGSFSNPHDLAGGVRLTVPLADEGTQVWMLQVREPATASDLGDDRVEVVSRIRVRNDSTSGDLMASDLQFVLVSADGSTGTMADASCSSGDDLNRQATIEPGKDIEGNVCWTVPAAQATDALLGIESIHAGGRVHVDLT